MGVNHGDARIQGDSYKALETEAEAIKDNIERILSKAKAIFGGSRIQERLESGLMD